MACRAGTASVWAVCAAASNWLILSMILLQFRYRWGSRLATSRASSLKKVLLGSTPLLVAAVLAQLGHRLFVSVQWSLCHETSGSSSASSYSPSLSYLEFSRGATREFLLSLYAKLHVHFTLSQCAPVYNNCQSSKNTVALAHVVPQNSLPFDVVAERR